MLSANNIIAVLPPKAERIFIAYSGGKDSHVLLHLANSISNIQSQITAVHVHHGLQENADSWVKHCENEAIRLAVNFLCLSVKIQKVKGQSIEELARDARYQALKTLLNKNDVLLVAQHREDQMETFLLQLFRGAGIRGLSGMASQNGFGLGLINRPLLEVPKSEINEYALIHGLNWVEDPSNGCNDFDRNFLRNQILPELKQRWPALDKTIARSALHCAKSSQLIDELAKGLFHQIFDQTEQTLRITALLELDAIKQPLLIRQWFSVLQLRMPSEKMVNSILKQVCLAKKSANPEVKGQNYSIRRYRDKLYCLLQNQFESCLQDQFWDSRTEQIDLGDGRKLVLKKTSEGISEKLWNNSEVFVRFRQGAEKIKLPGRMGHHSLKKLFQEKAVPPWQRNTCPLIYLDGQLAAVADLWISADFYQREEISCYQVDLEGVGY